MLSCRHLRMYMCVGSLSPPNSSSPPTCGPATTLAFSLFPPSLPRISPAVCYSESQHIYMALLYCQVYNLYVVFMHVVTRIMYHTLLEMVLFPLLAQDKASFSPFLRTCLVTYLSIHASMTVINAFCVLL